MKRLINRLRLLAGTLLSLAAIQAPADAQDAVIIAPVQPEQLMLDLPNTLELLVSGVGVDNPVSIVRFFSGDKFLGFAEEGIADNYYTFEYTPINSGDDTINVEVELDDGSIVPFDPVVYSVGGSGGPIEVSILAPADGSSYLPGTRLPVQVVATAPGSTVQRVEYYLNDTMISQSWSAPFSSEIFLPTAGDYSLTAKAFNISGDSIESEPITLSAGPVDNYSPRVTLDFPLPLDNEDQPNDVSHASSFFINAKAVDPDGTIKTVNFFINGRLLGEAERQLGDYYSFYYDPNALGSYLISAQAIDNDDNVSWSVPLALNVMDLTRPLAKGQMLSVPDEVEIGDTVNLFVETDGGLIGVTRVDFFINGVLIGSSNEPVADGDTYSFPWTTDTIGDYELEALIVQTEPNAQPSPDNWTVTEAIPVTVIEKVEVPKPKVEIFAPLDGSIYPAGTSVPVHVTAYDELGLIEEVEILLNGISVGGMSSAPYRAELLLPSPGEYIMQARVLSSTGQAAFSDPITLTAKDLTAGPAISIISPVTNSSYLPGTILPVQVQTFDPGGLIDRVEFLMNDVVVDTVTQAPFRTEIQLPSSSTESGTYVLTARSTSTTGRQAMSNEVKLRAGPPDSETPRVVIDFPLPLGGGDTVNDVSFASSMFINATVTDPNGEIIDKENVRFYINGEYLADAASSLGNVYSTFYDPNAQGNYVISVSATDSDGHEGWSLPLLLDVGPLERPLPQAEMVQPFPESILGRVVGIFVEADGGLIDVDRVDFFANGIYLGSTDEPVVDNLYSFNWIPQEPGDYDLQARIVQIDPADATFDNWKIADPVSISIIDPPAGSQPEISITNPENGKHSVVLRPIMVQVDALDPLGSIEEVRFYVNGAQQDFVDTTFPYGFTYEPLSPGQFQFVAEMVTDRGLLVHSDPVTVEVDVTQLPTGAFTSPGEVSPTAGSTVPLTVEASDPDGYVEYIEFYVNGRLLNVDESAPFTVFWNPLSPGDYDLTALVKDNSGHEVLIDEMVSVGETVGTVPRVTLSVTGSGNVTPGSRVVVLANVYDDDPDNVDVTFFMNGVQMGETDTEAPYSVIVDPEVGGISFGAYSLTAVAADKDGNSRADSLNPLYISDFSVDQPSIEIINIEDGDNYTLGSRIPIRVEIKGGAALNLNTVVFYADGEEIGRVNSGEATGRYSFDWLPDRTGTVELTAASLLHTEYYDHDRDSGGLAATPMIPVTPVNVAYPVNIEVNEAIGNLPSISLDIFPARDNLAIGSKVMIYADAQDLGGNVDKVELFLDGESIAVDTQAPFSHVLTTTNPGDFSLNALATDSDGNVVTSTVVNLEVVDRVITQTPEILLTVPSSGQEGNYLSLRASTEGFVNGPEAVVFYVNGQKVGESDKVPYSYPWLANLEGNLTFFATAKQPLFDGTLITTVSDVTESFLTGNLPPVIGGFTVSYPNPDPVAKPRPIAGDVLNFVVQMSDTGAINSVELLRDGDVVKTIEGGGSPFNFTDAPPGAGIYQYTAVVTDRGGLQTQSSTLVVTVDEGSGGEINPTLPEIQSFSSDVVGESSLVNLPIKFTVNAMDEEGIARVELYQDGNLVTTVYTEPYEVEFTPLQAGNYTFTARVVNLQGNQVNSESLKINVRQPDPLGQNTDFVYQTFIDMLMRTPSIGERNYYTNRIETEGLSKDRFIREIMDPPDGIDLTGYSAVRGVLLANKLLLDQWPTREEVEQDVETVKDGGLVALISSLMITFEPLYANATGAAGVPDIISPDSDIGTYVKYIWKQKYGKEPNSSQLNLGKLYFRSNGRDAFTAAFLEDNEVVALSSGYISLNLGFQFTTQSPPDDTYLREADAASLLINLLRVVPGNDEVSTLAQKLFATQVSEVINDPRYSARFATAFTNLKHYADGWKESDWFGWFNTSNEPWIYHSEQGWIAFNTTGQDEQNFWYWDAEMGWMWTQADLFPVLYEDRDDCWLLAPRTPYSATEKRWFFNYDQNMWIQP